MNSACEIQCQTTIIDDLSIHYRIAGTGPPVLLIHGWPTSSFLWRNVIPSIADQRRVVALDLPGFGHSDKPVDIDYNLEFFADVLDGFAEELDLGDDLALGVHDLGGPVGLYWAQRRTRSLERLAILNTIVYPEMSMAIRAFLLASKLPGLSQLLSSQWGLNRALSVGVYDSRRLDDEVRDQYCAPFREPAARKALLETVRDLDPASLAEVADWLPSVDFPVRIIRALDDVILPGMGRTVRRLQDDISHAEVITFENCGHFIPEDRPRRLGRELGEFFCDSP